GVTIQQMAEGIDTGNILLSEKCKIENNMNASELHDILKEIGARLIVKFTENPEEYIKNKTAQDNSLATYAPLITKEMKKINWSKSALEIFNFIRGLSGEAFTFLNNKRLKIFSSEIINNSEEYNQEPGTIYNGQLNGFDIICGDGKLLRLFEIQLEGKSRMKADEFLRGFKINAGDCLEK
ncbi:MAG: methionyl-tRNA formyltransferase, partial [Oscillospiraceae bacterium]|nr:methionyl-tRNA formyltransferase [Oscillospiraceae bacterium]